MAIHTDTLSSDVPAMPDDIDSKDIVNLAVTLLGIETLWGIVVLFANANGRPVRVSAAVEDEHFVEKYDPMRDLQEWHTAADEKPFIERNESERAHLAVLRNDMLFEETNEVGEELKPIWAMTGDFSRARLAVELVDVLYNIYGIADIFDIPIYKVFQLVHAKNMTKINPNTGRPYVVKPNGKVGKPVGFQSLTEAEIEAVIS